MVLLEQLQSFQVLHLVEQLWLLHDDFSVFHDVIDNVVLNRGLGDRLCSVVE